MSRTPWSCVLIHHELDQEVKGSNLVVKLLNNWKKERKVTNVLTEDNDVLGMNRNLDP